MIRRPPRSPLFPYPPLSQSPPPGLRRPCCVTNRRECLLNLPIQLRKSVGTGVVRNVPQEGDVERDVRLVQSEQYHRLANRMGDTNFVEHVWVPSSAIPDEHSGRGCPI